MLNVPANANNEPLQWPYVVAFPFVFVATWFVVIRILNAKSRMSKRGDVDPGAPLRESGWGSARVNGVSLRGCVKVIEYRDGWMLQAMSLFGGGKLWIPRPTTTLGPIVASTLFFPACRIVTSGRNEIRLYAKLTAFVA